MPELSGIYDSGPISPICKIRENISAWSLGKWFHYNVAFIEPIPRSSPTVVEMVTLSGATILAAAGTIAKQVVAILQLSELEFLHLRWFPLDDVEGVLWEQSGTARLSTRSVQARVSQFTPEFDPYLATTTFWILGRQRDMNLEVRNLSTIYPTPVARFAFFGYRYILTVLPEIAPTEADKTKLEQGDLETVKRLIGNTTWLPVEGR